MTTHQDTASNIPRVWLISGCSSGFGRALAQAALELEHREVPLMAQLW
jgi:NAD(P)-dependent dehydrogenase (short-subunit alcohol dehydrogenase family)